MLNKRQKEVVSCINKEDPIITICHGAVRSGKTFVLTYAFLHLLAKNYNKNLKYILGGASLQTLQRNVLDDIEQIIGKEIKLDKKNSFKIFGNRVYCLYGEDASAWKNARGFTAAGAFLNEGTALHDSFVKEVFNRCSYDGARIFIDTNPDNPMHPIKTDYIDNAWDRLSTGHLHIAEFNFTIFDNDTLTEEYKESLIKSTPSGVFTERNIYGRWVSPDGIVYPDFTSDLYVAQSDITKMDFTNYFCGVDWGYEHFGVVVVIGRRIDGKYVLVEEIARQHEDINFWVEQAKKIQKKYGKRVPFYCDSARPEHVAKFNMERIIAINANKSVLSGIEIVGSKFKSKELYICDNADRFKKEIYSYAWNEKTGEPVKINDDVMDALRYAIYTQYRMNEE